MIIAADERDVVGVRSNFRGEDVQIYRLKASPAAIRLLLRQYVADANELAGTPAFYNSITTNCTTTVVRMMRLVGDAVPLDWRLIVNGRPPRLRLRSRCPGHIDSVGGTQVRFPYRPARAGRWPVTEFLKGDPYRRAVANPFRADNKTAWHQTKKGARSR